MHPTTLDLLVRFQPAVAAAVGFTGVILTLIANAWLARRQVRDSRLHEAQTVARAIASELRFHEMILKGYIDSNGVMMSPPVTPTMDAYITKIGLIPPEQIRYVTDAYFVLKELNAQLVWIYRSDAVYDGVSPHSQHRQAQAALERALPAVQRAIVAIDPNPPPFKPLPGFDKPPAVNDP